MEASSRTGVNLFGLAPVTAELDDLYQQEPERGVKQDEAQEAYESPKGSPMARVHSSWVEQPGYKVTWKGKRIP